MSLSIDDVKHIAMLSRIHLTDEELKKYSAQLSAVLGYIETLNEVDTSSVEPTVNTTGITDRTREDEVKESLSIEEALQNRKNSVDGYFVVPNVLPVE